MTLGNHLELIEDIDRRMAAAAGTEAKLALLSEKVAWLKLLKMQRDARYPDHCAHRHRERAAML